LAEVTLHEGETLENALRRFKRKVLQEGIIQDVKRHAFYLKPGQKRRLKQVLARKRNRKKSRRDLNDRVSVNTRPRDGSNAEVQSGTRQPG
jgi:small subunit ribosomal protein S21